MKPTKIAFVSTPSSTTRPFRGSISPALVCPSAARCEYPVASDGLSVGFTRVLPHLGNDSYRGNRLSTVGHSGTGHSVPGSPSFSSENGLAGFGVSQGPYLSECGTKTVSRGKTSLIFGARVDTRVFPLAILIGVGADNFSGVYLIRPYGHSSNRLPRVHRRSNSNLPGGRRG